MNKRDTFGSKAGIILASVGSAVGLGNIWRFPYEAGQSGGGAFLILYLLCVLALGLPLMLTEFIIGRRSRANAVEAFGRLSGNKAWGAIGAAGIFTCLIIIGFYSVVAGWTIEYIWQSAAGGIYAKDAEVLGAEFERFISAPLRPIACTALFLIMVHLIIVSGVTKGIERSSKILMPMLFVMLLVLCVRSLMLPGAADGMRFLFQPDFSKIDSSVILSAMGQAFFSLSLGVSCMITYSSYFSREDNLLSSTLSIVMLDTLVALLAGVMIFPAVFSFGIAPSQGPTLVFVTLPNIFAQLPAGWLWSLVFFTLLCLAALTSIISLHEVVTAFVSDCFHTSRRKAALAVTSAGGVLAIGCSLSLGHWDFLQIGSLSLFDSCDFLSAKILMPLGALLTCIFAARVLSRSDIEDELSSGGRTRIRGVGLYILIIKYLAPIAIIVIFLNELGLFRA